MQTIRQQVRRVYDPMTLSAAVEVQGQLTQSHDLGTGEVSPSRTVTPTYLVPRVYATASDGSVDGEQTPGAVAWLVNGRPVAEVWASGEYSVSTAADASGRPKGTLCVMRDLTANETAIVEAHITVADTRLGINHTVEAPEVVLKCVGATQTRWDVGTPCPMEVAYNPLADMLDEYDWRKANGLLQAGEIAPELRWGNYLLRQPVTVKRGGRVLKASEYTVTVTDLATGKEAGFECGVSGGEVTFDMRLIEDGHYRVAAFVGGKKVGGYETHISRQEPTVTCSFVNTGSITASQSVRSDRVAFTTRRGTVASPDRCIRTSWAAAPVNASGVKGSAVSLGYGSSHSMALSEAGFTAASSALEMTATPEVKGAFRVATDKSGNYYTIGGSMVIVNG